MNKKYILVSTYGWEIDVVGFDSFEQAEKEMIKRFCEEVKYKTDDYVKELQGLLENGYVGIEDDWSFISHNYSKRGYMVDFSIHEIL